MVDDEYADLENAITIESEELLEYPVPGLPFEDLVVVLDEAALKNMQRHLRFNLQGEAGGLMLGQLHSSNGTTFVEVTDAIPAKYTESSFAQLKFNHQTWIDLDERKRRLFPDKLTVGWYHSHLGIGIFFSEHDRMVHRLVFAEPWLIGLVIDPIREEQGVFRWQGAEFDQCPYFLRKSVSIESHWLLSQELARRMRSLEMFTRTRPGFTLLAQKLADWGQVLLSHRQERRYLYRNLLEILQILEQLSRVDDDTCQLVSKLNQQLEQELLLDAEWLRPVAAKIPPGSSVVAVLGGMQAMLSPSNLLSVKIDNAIKLKVWGLPHEIDRLVYARDSNSLLLIGKEGSVQQVPLQAIGEQYRQQLPITLLGRIENTWLKRNHFEDLRAVQVSGNRLFLLTGRYIWKLDLEPDLPEWQPIPLVDLDYQGEASDFAIDADDNLFVVFPNEGQVSKLNPAGEVIYSLAEAGERDFNKPSSLTLRKNTLIILDSDNHRLVVFDAKAGRYQCQYHFGYSLVLAGVSKILSDERELYLWSRDNVFQVLD